MTSRYIKPPFFSHGLCGKTYWTSCPKKQKKLWRTLQAQLICFVIFWRLIKCGRSVSMLLRDLKITVQWLFLSLNLSNGIWRVRLQSPRCSISVAVVKWRGWTRHNRTKWASWQAGVEMWFYMILSVSGQIEQMLWPSCQLVMYGRNFLISELLSVKMLVRLFLIDASWPELSFD